MARQKSTILESLQLAPQAYYLATVHRPYNTDVPENLENILRAFEELDKPVIFPAHPRTLGKIDALEFDFGKSPTSNLRLIEPVGYLDMLMLLQNAALLLTDSGGMQKEAYFFAVPCLTLRPETEWVETVAAGWNVLVGADQTAIVATTTAHVWPQSDPAPVFGDGYAAEKIISLLYSELQNRPL
jgi:UDP-N-acetylglucosamine 2-epimerase